ncbi:aldo/keto reductase [Sedimentibacter hydroxybenzoicus DSM 7310]|uniref:Aldo/keto reductase n=1 Tax=Sedimentibacter hydroxybenzoicus DSM 7310 TaxID=1123245 RepID=A0A974GV54_SEDHY|nr:flavodoxin [Sedimentibacter hydroxybenzoicus]NYB72954.1 aldo/keto reductase [Sedimentibacter hydroxybenzoicus DSM 7310]
MKQILSLILSFTLFFPLAACDTGESGSKIQYAAPSRQAPEISTPSEDGSDSGDANILVAYFSATGNTRVLAECAADVLNADLYEIQAQTPYTSEDLNYNDSSSRTSKEQNDPSARPEISGQVENMEKYDIVILGYPIWWGQASKIVSTFLESYDFSGKTIVPFCTSGSSGIGSSDKNLSELCSESASWKEGKRFSSDTSREDVAEWLNSLELVLKTSSDISVSSFDLDNGENGKAPAVLLNSGYRMPVAGIGTYSLLDDTCVESVVSALKSGVRLIDTAYMYHNEAEVGKAVRESGVPREEIFVTTKLYPSQFDRAAEAIDEAMEKLNLGYIDLMLLHHPGKGDVDAYKAMEQAVKDGKIRSIGLSNWYIEEMEEFLPQITVMPALVQNEIHPYYQENDVIPYMHEKGIVMEGWYPLGGRGYTHELLNDETIVAIAQLHGKSAAQVILRWNLQKGVVVIPGSSNPDHISENISLFDFKLTEDEMERINSLDRGEKHDWY